MLFQRPYFFNISLNMFTNSMMMRIFLLFFLFILPFKVLAINIDDDTMAKMVHTQNAFASVAEKSKPAIVHILVKKRMNKNLSSEDGEDFFDTPLMKEFIDPDFHAPDATHRSKSLITYANGSGFIINSNGYILTNNHVVAGAIEISVFLMDRRKFTAKIIGRDPPSDVALLKIKGRNLPRLSLGNSDKTKVGDWAIAIGSPFQAMQTVTTGIISAKGRSRVGVSEYEDFLQTDAAINPGNSGGPLLNIHGRVIGMNTAFMTQNGGYSGIGFAIPINMATIIAERLQKNGKMIRAWLGVIISDADQELLGKLNDKRIRSAALIDRIKQDSPAALAALRQGDLIVAMNNVPVGGAADLRNRIALSTPGSIVKLTVYQKNLLRDISVTLGKLH